MDVIKIDKLISFLNDEIEEGHTSISLKDLKDFIDEYKDYSIGNCPGDCIFVKPGKEYERK